MTIEKRSGISQIEFAPDAWDVRLRIKLYIAENEEMLGDPKWHRTIFTSDVPDVAGQVGKVNDDLVRAGWPPLRQEDIDYIVLVVDEHRARWAAPVTKPAKQRR